MKMDQEEDGIPTRCIRESSILKSLNHINIIKLRETYTDNDQMILVLENLDTDLGSFLSATKKPLYNSLFKSYSYQLLKGLCYIHENGFIHCNIKPSNILIDSLGFLKISDFGSSQNFHHPMKRYYSGITSLWYRAPELVIDAEKFGLGIDIVMCGCIIAEMALGYVLFGGDSPIDQLIRICSTLGFPTNEQWKEFYNHKEEIKLPNRNNISLELLFQNFDPIFIDFLKKLLDLNPSTRITAIEALKHPFFNDIPKPLIDLYNQ